MIYTRTGDKGKTSTYNGRRIDKDSLEIETYGCFDELLAWLGYGYSKIDNDRIKKDLIKIMNDIHNLLSDIGKPENRITSTHITWLEERIEEYSKILKPLNTFILETSNENSAIINIARTICRRAERNLVRLSKEKYISSELLGYTNRLSDYLFTLFRYLNALEDIGELRYQKYKRENNEE